MKDDSLPDPLLQSLESRLAAAVPLASAARRQRLLYECAFAAGRSAAGRTLRRWQAAAAALSILLVGVNVPLFRELSTLALRPAERPVPIGAVSPPRTASPDVPATARRPAAVALDAWQVQPSSSEAFAAELARFEERDPGLRALALGALSREILKP